MKRYIFVTVFILCFVTVVSANEPQGPLQNVTVIDGIDQDVTAGDTDTVMMQFENHVRKSLPVYLAITVSSDQGIDGAEFAVDAGLISVAGEQYQENLLPCTFAGHQGPAKGVYVCWSEDRPVLPRDTSPSRNTVYASITSALNTAPGDYQFDVELYSMIGVPDERPKKKPMKPFKTTRFSFEQVSVSLNTSVEANATVEPYQSLSIPAPTDKTFIGGADIEVEQSGSLVPVNGTIHFDYDDTRIMPGSLVIYRYNRTNGEWDQLDSTLNTENQYVESRVKGSTTYAAFGEPAPQDDERSEDDADRNKDRSGWSGYESTGTRICTQNEWSCTNWSSCTNGTQTRTCDKTRTCQNGYEPQVRRSCTPTNSTPEEKSERTEDTASDTDEEENKTGQNTGINASQRDGNTGNTFTGALIQEKNKWAGIGIVAVLLFFGAYYVRRERSSRTLNPGP